MERNAQLLAQGRRTGVVVPSAFHANEGATGIRQLYLKNLALQCCYSFENRRKLFEIDSRFKFACVVAVRTGQPTQQFLCAFYIHDDEWLFAPGRQPLTFGLDFVQRTGGEYLSLLELRSLKDLQVVEVCFDRGEPLGKVCERVGIRLGRECDLTNDAWRFTPTADVLQNGEDPRDPETARRLIEEGYIVLHVGKTFRQYDDRWGERPRYLVKTTALADKPSILRRSRFFRVGYRDIAGPGDENVSIFNLHPPGITTGHTAPLEHEPGNRPSVIALVMLASVNSFPFDWLLQLRVRSHLNLFMLLGTPLSIGQPTWPLLAHSATPSHLQPRRLRSALDGTTRRRLA